MPDFYTGWDTEEDRTTPHAPFDHQDVEEMYHDGTLPRTEADVLDALLNAQDEVQS